jgi:hypothetical protein
MPMIVSLTYGEFVMDTKDAVTLMQILEKAEKYQTKYHTEGTTHHVYPSEELFHAKLLSADMYRMAKLAGKPEGS